MKNIKSFQDYNEKIDLKKALIGGALVTSLMGCNPQDVNKTEYTDTTDINNTELVDTKTDTLNLPNKFDMDEVVMTIGTDMELSSGDQDLGKIEERIVSWGKTFEYMGPNGTKLASGKQRVVSLVTTIDIFDEKDRKIGTFKEELFENFFSIKHIIV